MSFHYTFSFDKKSFNRWIEEEIKWPLHYWFIHRPYRLYRCTLNATYHRIRLGFNPEDTYSLDYSIAEYILPRLKHLKKNKHSSPSNMTDRQWNRELSKMIAAFNLIVNGSYYGFGGRRQPEQKVIDDGLDSFRKYFHHLWD